MATTRGRVVRIGGMAADAGATTRTQPDTSVSGQSAILRPAYRISATTIVPTTPQSNLLGYLDPNSLAFWRLAIGIGAVGYILGWHVKLGKLRIKI